MKKLIALSIAALLACLPALPAFAFAPMRDVTNADTATTDGADGTLAFNFKDSGGAWMNVFNEWGSAVYMQFTPNLQTTKDFILTFEVTGYDGGDAGYRAMPGIAVNGWVVQIWSLGRDGSDARSWEEVYDHEFDYYINGDGFYEMIIPASEAIMHVYTENWESEPTDDDVYIQDIQVIELGIYGVEKDSTLAVRIVDLKESKTAHSYEEVARTLDTAPMAELPEPSPVAIPSPDPEPDPSPDPEPEPTGNGSANIDPIPDPSPDAPPAAPSPSDDSDGGNGWLLWVLIGGGAILLAVVLIVVMMGKKKK